MSFEEAVPYVAAAYAVILVAILVWAALVARRTARLGRRLEDFERGSGNRATAASDPAAEPAGSPPDGVREPASRPPGVESAKRG